MKEKRSQREEDSRSQKGRMGGENGLVKSSKQEINLSGLQPGEKAWTVVAISMAT